MFWRYWDRELRRAVRRADKINSATRQAILRRLEVRPDDTDDALLEETGRRLADVWLTPGLIREAERNARRFARHQRRQWRRSLRTAMALGTWATHLGAHFNDTHRPSAVKSSDFKFEVLAQIHARACSAFGEIVALVRQGYPAGVAARGRLLHELAVVAAVLADAEQPVCESYLLHDEATRAHRMRMFNSYAEPLGHALFTSDQIVAAEALSAELEVRFGKGFHSEWAWAKPLLVERPTFAALERLAGLGHLRPYFQLASSFTHAGAHGTSLNSMRQGESTVLVAGSTDSGHAESLHFAAQSLVRTTMSFVTMSVLSAETSPDGVFAAYGMLRLSRFLADHCGAEEPDRGSTDAAEPAV